MTKFMTLLVFRSICLMWICDIVMHSIMTGSCKMQKKSYLRRLNHKHHLTETTDIVVQRVTLVSHDVTFTLMSSIACMHVNHQVCQGILWYCAMKLTRCRIRSGL